MKNYATRTGEMFKSDGSIVNEADGINGDGSLNIRILDTTKQLPDFNTGQLAAGAYVVEPTWQDIEGYRYVILTAAEENRLNSSWYVDHQFNDVPSGNRFNGNGAATVSNNNQATSIMDARLRYYRNYVRNDDVVPRTFIVKRRLFMF
ncbi:hypothetical protein ACFSUM_18580 [Virgibacillus siamensis]|uniref:hypothetical protein n=2 Tax=Bacillati TaxID=1783272 RepID=UPI0036257889